MGKIKKKTQDNVTAKDKTAVKKPVLKRQELAQKPTYKNLKMGVSLDEQSAPSRGSNIATKQDSLDYASGFKKGLNRKKDPMENLPKKWNVRKNYPDRVKSNSRFITVKEEV